MRRLIVAAVLCITSSLSAQSFKVEDDRDMDVIAGEGQSTAVAPGHPFCPAGRILVSTDEVRGATGTVVYRDLNSNKTEVSQFVSGPANPGDYLYVTNDHDLVSLSNGDVLYVTGAASRKALDPKPAWFDSAYRGNFGPGARSVVLVWRSTDCGKSFAYAPQLEFDPAKMQDGACALPQGALTHRHSDAASAKYLVPFTTNAQAGDDRFRWCKNCQQLFLEAAGQPAVCPRGGGHDLSGGHYKVTKTTVTGHESESGFQRCKACGTLFRATAAGTQSACIAQRTHEGAATAYFLPTANAAEWHRCTKCQAVFKDGSQAECPIGGRHASAGGYKPPLTSSTPGGETGWLQCAKCAGLYHANEAGDVCPLGGKHSSFGVNFTMLTSAPQGTPNEGGWKRCKHCGLLFQGNKQSASACPLVRPHDGAGSDTYVLAHDDGAPDPNLQPQWKACSKCAGVYFSGQVNGSCPVGGAHELPIYDMGGSDGQLVQVDRSNDRTYLTFQCVGRLQDTSFASDFRLSDKAVNKTLIAMAEKNASWQLIGVLGRKAWRIGVNPIDPTRVLFGWPNAVVGASAAQAKGPFSFEALTQEAPAGWGWENVDMKKDPYTFIRANMWGHTIVTRTPGTINTTLIMPDTIPGKGHGYRVFFHDTLQHTWVAEGEPVVPKSGNPNDVAFHLQAISVGDKGPSLLYWYDFDTVAKKITIRGRFIIGQGKTLPDFTISQANGAERSFATTTKDMWYGDYQTAGGYMESPTSFVFHPMWVEEGKHVHAGTVRYNPAGLAKARVLTVARPVPAAARVALSQMKPTQQDAVEERERD